MEFGGSCVAKMGDVVVSVGGDSVTSVEALCDGYCGGGGRGEWDWMMVLQSMGVRMVWKQQILQGEYQPYR